MNAFSNVRGISTRAIQSTWKALLLLLAALFLLPACTDFIAGVDQQKDWETEVFGSIILHYRPRDFSSFPSPSHDEAQRIVQNQNVYYRAIQDSIRRTFQDKVLIYLYNQDEADEMIGTHGGGHAIPKFNCFYYTYLVNRKQLTDQYQVEDPVIGAHELAHVITHRLLGYPGTKMMSEGYAVWLDGTYGGYRINSIIRSYRDDQPRRILTPDQLLAKSTSKESVYYPNAGVFIRFLVHTYGIENINMLFSRSADHLKDEFHYVTHTTWKDMSDRYAKYIEEL
jgi:hypothetical protein